MFQNSWKKRYVFVAILGALAAASGLASPPARAWADDEPLAPALKALQGMWIVEQNGSIQAMWTIKGDSVTARVDGVEYVGKLTVDDQAEPHPTLTADIEKGPDDVKGKSVKGIYKLDGERLTVNVAQPDADCPADFTPVDGKTRLFELTKVKR